MASFEPFLLTPLSLERLNPGTADQPPFVSIFYLNESASYPYKGLEKYPLEHLLRFGQHKADI